MGNWVIVGWWKLNMIIYCGLKTLYAHQAPKPDPLSLFVLHEVAQGHKMDEPSSCFVYKSVYVYIC